MEVPPACCRFRVGGGCNPAHGRESRCVLVAWRIARRASGRCRRGGLSLPRSALLIASAWLNWPLLVAERLARQVYWSSPRLRAWVKRRRSTARPGAQVADRRELRQYLEEVGVRKGALVMAHTSVSGLTLTDGADRQQAVSSPVALAKQLVDDLLDLLGPTGTLVMPTHARYQSEDESDIPGGARVLQKYDPARSPCGVGLANELFRKRKGVQRSLHPVNMLAAHGPMAAELLRDNLNRRKPLPHGVDSGYYRFCQHDGLVVSVGVPLGRYMTLIHTAEDVRDADWPIRNFFVERSYVVCVDGREETYVVRQRRVQYSMFCLCMRKLCRDLRREGILHEGHVGTVRVDWARSGQVFEYLMSRGKTSTYPYYWTGPVARRY